MTERPLLDIAASPTDPSPPVKSVQWSPTQPGLFFVLDTNSRYDPLALLALIDCTTQVIQRSQINSYRQNIKHCFVNKKVRITVKHVRGKSDISS